MVWVPGSKPNSLVTDTTGTWISEHARNGLLYGCLVEAYTFMKGDADMMQEYEKRYFQAISRLKNLGEADNTIDTRNEGMLRQQRS